MIGRKYTFESKSTRLRRLVVSGGVIFVLSVALITSFIAYIPIYAKMQKGRAAGAFFQKSPDAIAVFTGDKGRITYAMEILKRNPTSKLFISGVYAKNSYETLLDKQAPPSSYEELGDHGMQVDLDYESKNTFENVRETVEYLKSNPDLSNILIISSDYHIMRVKLISSHLIHSAKPVLFFDSVTSEYNSWKDIKKLLKEAVKIARTYVLLKILREDIVKED